MPGTLSCLSFCVGVCVLAVLQPTTAPAPLPQPTPSLQRLLERCLEIGSEKELDDIKHAIQEELYRLFPVNTEHHETLIVECLYFLAAVPNGHPFGFGVLRIPYMLIPRDNADSAAVRSLTPFLVSDNPRLVMSASTL